MNRGDDRARYCRTFTEEVRAIVDELRAHRQPKPSTVYLVDIDDEILMCLEEALRLAVG